MKVKFIYHKINYFKENDSVVFSAFTMLCSHHLIPRYFCHPKVKPLNPLSSHPTIHLPPVPGMCICVKLRKRFGVGREIGESVGRCECDRENVDRKEPGTECGENIQRPEDPALGSFISIIS